MFMYVIGYITAGIVAGLVSVVLGMPLSRYVTDRCRSLALRSAVYGSFMGIGVGAGMVANFIVTHRPVDWGFSTIIAVVGWLLAFLWWRWVRSRVEKSVA